MASSSSQKIEPSPEQIDRVTKRIKAVQERIRVASERAGRDKEPRLVAISKLHPPSAILAAHTKAGLTHFGENYAQELEAKAKVLPDAIKWHFVGKLQSNKAKLVAGIPNLHLLETLDSAKCATALEKALKGGEARKEPMGVYLQINTSGEEAKGGMEPLHATSPAKVEVFELAKHVILGCPSLQFRGVMTIGAASNSQASKDETHSGADGQSREQIAEAARSMNPDFARLYETRRLLVERLRDDSDVKNGAGERYRDLLQADDGTGGLELSMGMSNDLEVAIRAGSNNVRVGTDCFGVRPPSRDEAMEAMKDEL